MLAVPTTAAIAPSNHGRPRRGAGVMVLKGDPGAHGRAPIGHLRFLPSIQAPLDRMGVAEIGDLASAPVNEFIRNGGTAESLAVIRERVAGYLRRAGRPSRRNRALATSPAPARRARDGATLAKPLLPHILASLEAIPPRNAEHLRQVLGLAGEGQAASRARKAATVPESVLRQDREALAQCAGLSRWPGLLRGRFATVLEQAPCDIGILMGERWARGMSETTLASLGAVLTDGALRAFDGVDLLDPHATRRLLAPMFGAEWKTIRKITQDLVVRAHPEASWDELADHLGTLMWGYEAPARACMRRAFLAAAAGQDLLTVKHRIGGLGKLIAALLEAEPEPMALDTLRARVAQVAEVGDNGYYIRVLAAQEGRQLEDGRFTARDRAPAV